MACLVLAGCAQEFHSSPGSLLKTPLIVWAAPAAIAFGTALSAAQLNASASVPGSFAYAPAMGTVLPAGTHTLSVTFTPAASAGETVATASVQIVVNPSVPVLSWPNPAAISYGAALSAAQLNATANVPGSFTYAPALGSVLHAGHANLSVTFTPADATDFTTASANAELQVNPAAPVVTWPAPAAISYGSALSAAQLDASANVPGSFTYAPALGSVLHAGHANLSVTFTRPMRPTLRRPPRTPTFK
jgi:hypothetical protein